MGGLIDEAGDAVHLYMANRDENADIAGEAVRQRPRSIRLKRQLDRRSGHAGDSRRRDEHGHLLITDLLPSDLAVGVQVATSKKGYYWTGEIARVRKRENATQSSSSSSTQSECQYPAEDMEWEVKYQDETVVWLNWDEIRFVR